MDLPQLTTAQMVEVDRAMIEDLGIELIQMMENAGRNLARLSRARFLGGDPRGRSVIVLAGRGGNGGGALVCARHLRNWGANVRVVAAAATSSFTGVPYKQLSIVTRMGITVSSVDTIASQSAGDLIVDGLVGYSLRGAPRGSTAQLIRWANAQSTPTLALDVPSGIDAATGTVFEPVIAADATMTLALPKQGLKMPAAAELVGELYLADISVPPSLYAGPGLELDVDPLFARDEIIRL